jgi:hypothetical protein
MLWIPLIGPILQGLMNTAASIYSKFADTKIAGIQAEVTDAQTAEKIIADTNDDLGLRIIRDFALVPPVLWSALIGWDTIVSLRYPWLKFHVSDYPEGVRYIPYGAFAFLFGLLGFKIWKGRL